MRAWMVRFCVGRDWLAAAGGVAGVAAGGSALVALGAVAMLVAAWWLAERAWDCYRPRFGIGVALRGAHAHSRSIRRLRCVRVGWSAVWIAAICVGFGYAAWRAEMRLAVSLPQRVGRARYRSRRQYQRFAVARRKGRAFPVRSRIGRRAGRGVSACHATVLDRRRRAQRRRFEPGERWRLTVRLKRPHGNANFGVRDAEADLLARNVRATGYVSAPAHARRLPGQRAWRWRDASIAGARRCVRASTRCSPTRRIAGSSWRWRSARRTKSAPPTGC